MKGVTILNEKKVCKTELIDFILVGMASIIFGAVAICGFLNGIIVGSVMCVLASVLFMFIFTHMIGDKVTQYECLIDKKTLDNNFIDTYQIIDKRGDIYVIEEINS